MERVKIRLDGGFMPTKGSVYAAAYDLYCPDDFVLKAGRNTIDLGFSMELPVWWKANIRPRSGFASKGMLVTRVIRFLDGSSRSDDVRIDADVLLGLVDCDYRGHVGVTVKVNGLPSVNCIDRHDLSRSSEILYILESGTRFAQMEICRGHETELVEVRELDMSNDRGGGFGHTGTK